MIYFNEMTCYSSYMYKMHTIINKIFKSFYFQSFFCAYLSTVAPPGFSAFPVNSFPIFRRIDRLMPSLLISCPDMEID